MADTQLVPISVSTSNGASFTQVPAVTSDGESAAILTTSDDGAGNLAGGRGTISGKALTLKLVDSSASVQGFQAQYENAAAFQGAIANGTAASGTLSGGAYSSTTVYEYPLRTSNVVVVSYRTGAAAPRSVVRTVDMPPVTLDLCPYTKQSVVPGSVRFLWMGQEYEDFEGVIYRGRTATSPGIVSGSLPYASGLAVMTDYVVGGSGPTDFQLLSLFTQAQPTTASSIFFSTDAAPLRPGAGGFVLTVVDTEGATLTANIDAQGFVTGPHQRGRVDLARGGVELQYGDFVDDATLPPAEKTQWWYSAADVGAVEAGKVWKPHPVLPETMRYSCISYIYLPVDVSLMGIDPAALPADGRVAFARPGDTCVVGVAYSGAPFVPSNGMVYNVGNTRLSLIQVLGPDGAPVTSGYTADLDAGTVNFTDVTGYPATVTVVGRTEVYRQIAEVRIDGRVRLTQQVGYAFDAGAVFSTALRQGDRFARVKRVYGQYTWDKVSWADDLVGNPSVGKYDSTNRPILVTNDGAITERWALSFKTNTTFDLIGQHLGLIASGNVNEDFSPINPARGAPYFTLYAAGLSAGFIQGNALFIDTVGAAADIAVLRCTQPSTPAGVTDSVGFIQRGDVDTPPSAP